ncbi:MULTISPECIES: hypothetical protein [unclassified Prosthecochloris]|uniref:hypothetical protein n=1 Tax=unclassified Prosthecochloris TaxID=2632826 RepID=UPI00223E4EFF|nr:MULTISPECIES: hypothetical protein [unclassified Prosthecochloris]UZJ37723.1 hypothetical protein OO005_00495 [Prosthecochloris sp. SCSIO W1103]UZJ41539.1 hypothetical protein OO006_00550 [Prosthecochloris sp. SCSIO W1101]
MYKLFVTLILALGITLPVYAGNKIVRNVDDFSGLEMVTYKKPLKFEKMKGPGAIGVIWLTPEAAINPDGSIAWLRWDFERMGVPATGGRLGISKAWGSTLKLKLDDNEVLEFQAINSLSDVDVDVTSSSFGTLTEYREYALFTLSRNQLYAIAKASEIKGRVTGSNGKYVNIPYKVKWHKIHQDWMPEMRRFYNEVFSALPAQTGQP